MLDEKALRRPNFDELNSAPVVLADGQTWSLPKPVLIVRPVFRGGRAVDSVPVLTCGPEFTERKDAVFAAEGEAIIPAGADLAAYMLLRHYDLSDDQLGELLGFDAGAGWLREVMAVANGLTAPKVSSAGSD